MWSLDQRRGREDWQQEHEGGVALHACVAGHCMHLSPPSLHSLLSFPRVQAAETARILKSMGWVPDVVLASNAKRTRQTLDEMTSVIEGLGAVDAHLYGSLYTVAALDGQTRQHIEVGGQEEGMIGASLAVS